MTSVNCQDQNWKIFIWPQSLWYFLCHLHIVPHHLDRKSAGGEGWANKLLFWCPLSGTQETEWTWSVVPGSYYPWPHKLTLKLLGCAEGRIPYHTVFQVSLPQCFCCSPSRSKTVRQKDASQRLHAGAPQQPAGFQGTVPSLVQMFSAS